MKLITKERERWKRKPNQRELWPKKRERDKNKRKEKENWECERQWTRSARGQTEHRGQVGTQRKWGCRAGGVSNVLHQISYFEWIMTLKWWHAGFLAREFMNSCNPQSGRGRGSKSWALTVKGSLLVLPGPGN